MPPQDLPSALTALRQDTDVLFAEPNYEIELLTGLPNDPRLPGQWGVFRIRAHEAWNSWNGTETPDFRVAVIDSGIAYDHPDLVDNIWTNPLEQPSDCNNNTVFDATDIANHTSNDCNSNGMPDECDDDCDGNGVPDSCEVNVTRPCCFAANTCHTCLNLTPCEYAARGGISGPAGETCHYFNCTIAPD